MTPSSASPAPSRVRALPHKTSTPTRLPPSRPGVFGDWLNRLGMRGWLTAGSCIVAAPLIAVSLLVPDSKQSFAALLVGFAFRCAPLG